MSYPPTRAEAEKELEAKRAARAKEKEERFKLLEKEQQERDEREKLNPKPPITEEQRLNECFCRLRQCLPNFDQKNQNREKTLWFAIKYIEKMQEELETTQKQLEVLKNQ